MRSRVMRAPTTSWWWNVTPLPWPIRRGSWACRRRGTAPPGGCAGSRTSARASAAHVLDHRDGVGEHVLVAVDRVLLEAHGRQLGQELARPGRCRRGTTGRRPGRRRRSACRARRGCARPTRSRGGRASPSTAATSSGTGLEAVAGDEAGGPQHAQRVVAEATPRAQRRAQPLGGEVGGAVERVDERRRVGAARSAMALTVKSRRDRSASMASANTTSGLRESGVVGLGPVGGDLVGPARPGVAPMVPKRSPWVHTASAQPARMALISAGRASVVRSMSPPPVAAEQQVADGAARRGTAGGPRRGSARPAGRARRAPGRSARGSRG